MFITNSDFHHQQQRLSSTSVSQNNAITVIYELVYYFGNNYWDCVPDSAVFLGGGGEDVVDALLFKTLIRNTHNRS